MFLLRGLFSFPPVTEMFHFAGYASFTLMVNDQQGLPVGVSPFGNPGLRLSITYPRLIADFPRPSSLVTVKASSVRP